MELGARCFARFFVEADDGRSCLHRRLTVAGSSADLSAGVDDDPEGIIEGKNGVLVDPVEVEDDAHAIGLVLGDSHLPDKEPVDFVHALHAALQPGGIEVEVDPVRVAQHFFGETDFLVELEDDPCVVLVGPVANL